MIAQILVTANEQVPQAVSLGVDGCTILNRTVLCNFIQFVQHIKYLRGRMPARLISDVYKRQAVAAARALQAGGLPPAAAAKQAAAGTPFSKGEIYKELIK